MPIHEILGQLNTTLGESLRAKDPFLVLDTWLREAHECGAYDDANAVALATASLDGKPSVRMVLCKSIEVPTRSLTFYTNYESRKGRELAENPRAAMVFHWPHAKRQARVEGTISRMSDAESDAYFKTRPLISKIGAIASRQSSVLESRSELIHNAIAAATRAAVQAEIKRPPYWGGFRLHATNVELWVAEEGRMHQRVRWLLQDDGVWHWACLSP